MRLAELVFTAPQHLAELEVNRLAHDSREVAPGTLFFAIEGLTRDGHDYVATLVEKNPAAIVVRADHPKTKELNNDPRLVQRLIEVPDTRKAMAEAATRFYGMPSKRMIVCGVTGTNGKTTSTYLLEALLKEWAMVPAVMGTVENRCGDFRIPSTHTTADAISLQHNLHQFLKHGARSVAMEVSSHALDQLRVWGMQFEAGLFTNLTQDHLDYHQTMQKYFEAKAKFFTDYPLKVRAIHYDDHYGRELVSLCMQKGFEVITFGSRGCNVNYGGLHLSATGIEGTIQIARKGGLPQSLHIKSPLLGDFNAQNIAGAVAVAIGLGIPIPKISTALSQARQVPGRMETIPNKRGVTIVVDYAHSPDALEKALKTLRPLCKSKLVCVFGCGGDRDAAKRPLMGAIAERVADEVHITSDNPRTENPENILDQIISGLKAPSKAIRIADRRQAILQAISGLKKDDILLIAGKGHEDYQIIGTQKIHFDDRLIAADAVK